MVYIDRDGRVLDKRPWDMARIVGIFTGLWLVIVQFFQTLIAPFNQENRNGANRRGGNGGWGSGGGYGGGGGGGGSSGGGSGGGNGGLRPNRRIGRITNSMDCNIPGGG